MIENLLLRQHSSSLSAQRSLHSQPFGTMAPAGHGPFQRLYMQHGPHRWRAVSTQKLYASGISENQLHSVQPAGKLVEDPLFIGLVLRHKGGRKTDIIADIIEGNC